MRFLLLPPNIDGLAKLISCVSKVNTEMDKFVKVISKKHQFMLIQNHPSTN